MTQELVLRPGSAVEMTNVSTESVEKVLWSNSNVIDFHTHHCSDLRREVIYRSPWAQSESSACEIGIVQLTETGTLYDALAEIEARGFAPAYSCELLSLWRTNSSLWRKNNTIFALAETKNLSHHLRWGAYVSYTENESVRQISNRNKAWKFTAYAWYASNFTPLIEKGTALAVTRTRNHEPFCSNMAVHNNTELQLIRMAQMRARAKFTGGPNADAVMMNSMIVSLLAEISSNLSQIPDMARQLEEMNETVKAGAVLNYNEQVDIYNKLVDIKNIMLNRYKED